MEPSFLVRITPLTNCHSVTYGLQFTIVSVVVLSVKWTTARTRKVRPGMASAFTLHPSTNTSPSFPLTFTVCIRLLSLDKLPRNLAHLPLTESVTIWSALSPWLNFQPYSPVVSNVSSKNASCSMLNLFAAIDFSNWKQEKQAHPCILSKKNSVVTSVWDAIVIVTDTRVHSSESVSFTSVTRSIFSIFPEESKIPAPHSERFFSGSGTHFSTLT